MSRADPNRDVCDTTYLELVRSLSATLLPGAISTAMFVVTAFACAWMSPDPRVTALAVLGSVAAAVRLIVVVRFRQVLRASGADVATARRAERLFGAAYLAFAVILGLFGGICIAVGALAVQLPVAALVVGYGGGVAAGISLRPWIALPAVTVSVTPSLLMSVVIGDVPHLLLAFLLSALMAGAVGSILARYRSEVEMIELRQTFSSLARQDPLTGLGNRLALDEGFAAAIESCGSKRVVLHCFDLDRFKPVNDVHGHVVGDQLLKALAGRLGRLIREGDLAVRLGGDEFAVLQTGIRHDDEAEMMARRIARAISEPYGLGGVNVTIGVSVGSARGKQHGADLTRLLTVADKALYKVKHSNAGPAQALAS